eukprot:TRINITY_DN27712_c0_g1_i3.p2 TRINITY_DN27712_c0_g1~~TRINITY_DN27712_c0_g1_i3.p2  ORF type:complete len:108 (+),score=18.36 TRINITY_DN27712_c0_g1_i3:177-500(+)
MCIRDSSRKACFGATSMVSAGGGSHASLWVAGGLLSQSRLLCNLLDGMVAGELRGKGEYHNKMGHVYNELPDRVSDAAMLIGLGTPVAWRCRRCRRHHDSIHQVPWG